MTENNISNKSFSQTNEILEIIFFSLKTTSLIVPLLRIEACNNQFFNQQQNKTKCEIGTKYKFS